MGAADKFHDNAAGNVAVFVHVDGAVGVGDEEFTITKTEHP